MERDDFLRKLSLGIVLICGSDCLISCAKNDALTGPSNVDFTIDLNDPEYTKLGQDGGYIYKSQVIVARISAGQFIALQQICTHQGTRIEYIKSEKNLYCPQHGSRFDTSGNVLVGPANVALKRYNTALSGNSLRVFS